MTNELKANIPKRSRFEKFYRNYSERLGIILLSLIRKPEWKQYNPIEIPASGPYQHIYVQDLKGVSDVENIPGYTFKYIHNIFDLNFSLLRQIFSFWGFSISLKNIIKIATPSRSFYCVTSRKESVEKMVNFGWIELGWCKRYKVEKTDAAFDGIFTVKEERDRGLATYSLKNALNALYNCGYKKVYIDCFAENERSKKLFTKCGFKGPINFYIRKDKLPGAKPLPQL